MMINHQIEKVCGIYTIFRQRHVSFSEKLFNWFQFKELHIYKFFQFHQASYWRIDIDETSPSSNRPTDPNYRKKKWSGMLFCTDCMIILW